MTDPGPDLVGDRDVPPDADEGPGLDLPPDVPAELPVDTPAEPGHDEGGADPSPDDGTLPDTVDVPAVDTTVDAPEDVATDTPADIPGDLATDTATDPGPVHRVCSVDNGGCSPHASCTDGFPQPACYCRIGWEGNGFDCTNVDECARQTDICDDHATCHDQDGTYGCTCNPGYDGDGYSCIDVNECARTEGICGLAAFCTNTDGSYSCTCQLGAAADGGSCRWTMEIAGTGQDVVQGVATDSQQGTYLLVDSDGYIAGPALPPGVHDIAIVHYDSTGFRDWVRPMGSVANDYPGGIVVDSERNILVTGTAGAAFGTVAAPGVPDAFVTKHDPAGQEAWTIYLGTALYDAGTGIALHGDSVYVSGYTSGTFVGQSSQGSVDAFVARVDLDGNIRWVRQFGTWADDRATAVAVSSTGQVFVAGWTRGDLVVGAPVGEEDAFVATFDADGNAGWIRQFGSIGNDEVLGLATDADSGVWLAGMAGGALPSQTGLGGNDAFLARYGSTGTQTFLTQFGTDGEDFGQAVVPDATGAWVAATIGGAMGGQSPLGGTDAALVRLDLAGVVGSVKVLGTGQNDRAAGLVPIAAGGMRLALTTWGDVTGGSHRDDPDAVAIALDSQVSQTWARQAGSYVATGGSRITLDADDTAYVLGWTTGNIGSGTGQTWATDAFLARLKPNGSTEWLRQYGTGFDDTPAGIALSSSGVVLVGSSVGLPDGGYNPDGRDVILAPYGLDGTPGTVTTWGTDAHDHAWGAVGTAGGDIYVVGQTWGTLDVANAGQSDLFAARFGADLDPVWAHQLGTSTNDVLNAVALHPDGGIVATGSVVTPLAGAVQGGGVAGSGGVIVVRFDADGTRAWMVAVGSEYSDSGDAIAVDPDGDVYIAGTTYGDVAYEAVDGTDLFVMRLSGDDGHVLWAHQFGTTGNDVATGIALGPDGRVYVSGTLDGELAAPSDGTIAQGLRDAVVVRLDADGTDAHQWPLGTNLDDAGSALAVDSRGNLLLLGSTRSSFGVATAQGAERLFLMKR